ncbi:MAG TPA: glycosyltransferase [Pyrinomonadaceae bacterium]|nr:glycosyltransferase [Pyrinomonadaceae bacterium]
MNDLLLLKGQFQGSVAADPRSSVIVLAWNEAEYTFQCLRSLLRKVDLSEHEIIVINNGSTDQTEQMLEFFSGLIRVVTNKENLGFVGGNNSGAAVAKGKYLVFVNNDTIVLDGWLEALIDTFEDDPRVGAAGSLFLYPDGRVQEAGSIVFSDGSAHHYGWGGSPKARKYLFAREVDYCSGASLMIRRDLFEQLGGYDERFAPIYYEDTDLCFGVRSLGYRVIYQPASKIIHFEGKTSGTDVNVGLKRYQVINKAGFIDKWKEVLKTAHLEKFDANVEAASDRRRDEPIFLIFDERIPTPDRDAGSLRSVSIMKVLRQFGRPIFVSVFGQSSTVYEEHLWKAGIQTLGSAFWRDIPSERVAAVILSRPEVAEMFAGKVRRRFPNARIIYDMVDAHFVRLAREAEVTSDPGIAASARSHRRLELGLAKRSDVVWCNSSADEALLKRFAPGVNTAVVTTIHNLAENIGKSVENRKGLLFIGNMEHRPNRDGILYFLTEVWLLIRDRLGDVRLTIIGQGSDDEIMKFESEGVEVKGYVPDLSEFLADARVFIAPIRFGAGTKGKIGEALAAGLPVVTTAVGAEGMSLTDGENILIAADPASFAESVSRLYEDDALWKRVSKASVAHISDHFTPERVSEKIRSSVLGPE